MRARRIPGLAGAILLVAAGASAVADSGRPAAAMIMTAPAAAAGTGWGSVPDAALNPPAQPGGWGTNGWHGGAPDGTITGAAAPGDPAPAPMQRGGPTGHDRPGTWQGGGRGGWHGRYSRVGPGYRLPRFWLSPGYAVSDWGRYGLWRPGYGQNWIRYYDDALLIDGSGRVIDGRYGLDWDRGNYDYGYGRDDDAEDYGYAGGGYDDGQAGDYGSDGVTIHRGPDSTVVVVRGQPGVTTTTTTTTYEDVPAYSRRRPGHGRKRSW